MRKPHPGLQQFGVVFPDGRFFALREIEHHDAAKIAADQGSEGPLPPDWLVETEQQRKARQAAAGRENIA
jgi:hypothetical protein